LEQIYRKNFNSDISLFEDDRLIKIKDVLGLMFDEDNGDDLLNVINPQFEALLPYYSDVEKWAIKIADDVFKTSIKYFEKTKDQQEFIYKDNNNHTFHCFLDGYKVLDDEVIVIEVKATTSKKFLDLGPKRKNSANGQKYNSIFEENNNILTLKTKLNDELTVDKFSSNYQKLFDRFSNVGKYVFDIAVERYIIENSVIQNHPKLNSKKFKYYLAVLNSNYVFDNKYINNEPDYSLTDSNNSLFSYIDLTEVTKEYLPIIEKLKNEIVLNIYEKKLDSPILDKYCELKKSSKCFFDDVCWESLKKPGSILEYMNSKIFYDLDKNKHSKYDLVNQGKIHLEDIPVSWLSNPNQIIQRKCFDNKSEYINIDKIEKYIDILQYPIYHLDFESFPCPLPRFHGEKPYSQSLFQFSIHIEKGKNKCDEINDHISFLVDDFGDHRKELIEKLINIIDLTNGGTVLVYNKSFEQSRIQELSELFPEYKEQLDLIINHMHDLMDILKSKQAIFKELGFSEIESKTVNYYHNDLRGLYSIKKVLPLFSSLTYSDLNVKNGIEAISSYAAFKTSSIEDIKRLRASLIEYCRQDTWSMVLILNNIIKKIEDKVK